MRKILLFVCFVFSISSIFAQEITFKSLFTDKAIVQISNKEIVEISFGDYFRAEGETFNLMDYYVYSDSLNHKRIGKYGKNRLKLGDGKQYKYKLDRRNERVLVFDKDKNIVFEGKLFYDEDFGYLESIEIVNTQMNNKMIEAWVTLSTVQRLYVNETKDFMKDVLFGAVFGVLISVF